MRYWKIISISIISVLVLGTFYIQAALAETNYPEFTFISKSGDDEIVKSLILRGTYYESEHGQNVTIKQNETDYSNDLSLMQQINGYYIFPEIKRLQEEYRSFMRGKGTNIATFYEDEELLAYAEIDSGSVITNRRDFNFDIEVLEKESGETEAFELEVPEKNQYDFMYVEDVQMLDDELKVVTRQVVKRSNEVEFHVYSFDASAGKLISDDLITSCEEEQGTGWSYTELISSGSASADKNKYVAFVKTVMEEMQGENGEIYSQESTKELVTYDFESKQMKSTELPVEITADGHQASLIGTMIYFPQETEAGVEIIAYNIESEEIGSSQMIDLLSREQEDYGLQMNIHEEKIYLANLHGDEAKQVGIAVIDLGTEKLLYEGSIEMKNPNSSPSGYDLFLNQMMIQE